MAELVLQGHGPAGCKRPRRVRAGPGRVVNPLSAPPRALAAIGESGASPPQAPARKVSDSAMRGGRVAAIVYSTPERNAFFSTPVKIIRERAQLPPPLPGQPGPFSLGGEGVLEAAFAKAGLRDIEVHKVASPVRLPSAAECVRFERESFGALHQMMVGLGEEQRIQTW